MRTLRFLGLLALLGVLSIAKLLVDWAHERTTAAIKAPPTPPETPTDAR